MTKAQRIAHKLMIAHRREHFLKIYRGVKPAAKGWIVNPGFAQSGKFGTIGFDEYLKGSNAALAV